MAYSKTGMAEPVIEIKVKAVERRVYRKQEMKRVLWHKNRLTPCANIDTLIRNQWRIVYFSSKQRVNENKCDYKLFFEKAKAVRGRWFFSSFPNNKILSGFWSLESTWRYNDYTRYSPLRRRRHRQSQNTEFQHASWHKRFLLLLMSLLQLFNYSIFTALVRFSKILLLCGQMSDCPLDRNVGVYVQIFGETLHLVFCNPYKTVILLSSM